MSKTWAIGIDFGTTKTSMFYALPDKDTFPADSFPTAVRFLDDKIPKWEGCEIGADAFTAPQGWKNFKIFMSENHVPVDRCCGMTSIDAADAPSPVLLASFVFRRLRNELIKAIENQTDESRWVKNYDEIGPVTITVPAECNFRHRQAVVFAANVAGFKNIHIIEEPVAAYLYHYYSNLEFLKKQKKEKSMKAFVIDFGGGTCDFAILESHDGKVPFVVDSRTIQRGGNNIDDAIVGLWTEDENFSKQLPDKEQFDQQITQELRRIANLAKHLCNPRPDERKDKLIEMLKDPLSSQLSSNGGNLVANIIGVGKIIPPSISPVSFNTIMPDFVADIDAEIDYLLPTMEDLRSVDKVIFAGGSCYVRQILEFIMNKFDHLTRDQDFFFNEPENAIAKGALAYQKERNKGRNPISTRLSMSTYLQLDYDKHDIPDWLMTGSNFKFISHNGKNYIELASKGAPLTQENPRVNGFGSLFKNPKFIPVKKTQQETKTTWKIFQIRSSAHNGRDYEAITDKTEPIDEITFSLSTFENAINNFAPLRLIYAFDIYGDFYRNVRILTQRKSDLKNLHEKNPDLDWRNQDKVRDIRDTLFGSENRGNQ